MTSGFEDLIYNNHHKSKKRPSLSAGSRAAQFSPFSALTGYEEAVREAERITEERKLVADDMADILNRIVFELERNVNAHPIVKIIYFSPDTKKSGGEYRTVFGRVECVDRSAKQILLENGIIIKVKNIVGIQLI